MTLRIHIDTALVVQLQSHRAILRDAFHCSKFAIGDLQFLAGRGELDAIAYGEPLLVLSVDGDSNLATWVIGGLLSVSPVPPSKCFA